MSTRTRVARLEAETERQEALALAARYAPQYGLRVEQAQQIIEREVLSPAGRRRFATLNRRLAHATSLDAMVGLVAEAYGLSREQVLADAETMADLMGGERAS